MVGGSTRSGLFKNYVENLIFKTKYSQIWYWPDLFFRNQAKPVLKDLMTRLSSRTVPYREVPGRSRDRMGQDKT